MKNPELISLAVPTRDGAFIASYSADGLAAVTFPSIRKPALARTVPAKMRSWHSTTSAALKAALAGRAPKKLPPLDLSAGTAFQQRVWNVLRKIQCGRTLSYAEVARALGKPGAARAVGGACGSNPIPVLVPCHRVLAANRKIGGFSGGLRWKRLLLGREGG
jgi:O-6-methylguanine DNA methyltransferase